MNSDRMPPDNCKMGRLRQRMLMVNLVLTAYCLFPSSATAVSLFHNNDNENGTTFPSVHARDSELMDGTHTTEEQDWTTTDDTNTSPNTTSTAISLTSPTPETNDITKLPETENLQTSFENLDEIETDKLNEAGSETLNETGTENLSSNETETDDLSEIETTSSMTNPMSSGINNVFLNLTQMSLDGNETSLHATDPPFSGEEEWSVVNVTKKGKRKRRPNAFKMFLGEVSLNLTETSLNLTEMSFTETSLNNSQSFNVINESRSVNITQNGGRNRRPTASANQTTAPAGRGHGRGKGKSRAQETFEASREVKVGFLAASIVVDVVGIGLNIPSYLVFRRMDRCISNAYIMNLLVLDTAFLVVNVPYSVMGIVSERGKVYPVAYVYYRLYFETIAQKGLQNAISSVTCLFTLGRFLAIAFPFRNRTGLLNRPFVATVVLCLISATVSGIMQSLSWGVEERFIRQTGTTAGVVTALPTFTENLNLFFALNLTIAAFLSYLPALIMVVANIGMLITLIRHKNLLRKACRPEYKNKSRPDYESKDRPAYETNTSFASSPSSAGASSCRAKTGYETKDQPTSRTAAGIRSALVALVYSSIYLVLTLPSLTFLAINAILSGFRVEHPEVHLVLKTSFPLLGALSSAVNFFVYFAVCERFRVGFRVGFMKLIRRG